MKSDNELIAEFMGWKYYSDYGHHRDVYYEEAVIDPADPDFVMTPHWNESWDWLMPVVEKIGSLGFKVEIIILNQGPDYFRNPTKNTYRCAIHKCYWMDSRFHEEFVCGRNDVISMIDSTYKSVVKFIKWHKSVQQ